jgi:anti-sigma factor RsiW
MNATEHVRAQLSAYLDDALGTAERLTVDRHLDTCADCRARLGELRATVSLIGRLPDPTPTRRLVPRVGGPPVWLAPLRTVTTMASGLSVFLFLATALLANVSGLATGAATSAAAPAAAPAAPLASANPSLARGAAPAAAGTSAPTALSNADTAKQAASATPPSAGFAVTQRPADAAAQPESAREARTDRAPLLANPWIWLGLAIVLGIVALAMQRRLRSVK